jgi:hypothetical protein
MERYTTDTEITIIAESASAALREAKSLGHTVRWVLYNGKASSMYRHIGTKTWRVICTSEGGV